MLIGIGHLEATRVGTTLVASFLASLVECVEALTVVLAVGSVRGWRSALAGALSALALLAGIVALIGPLLTRIPLHRLSRIPLPLLHIVVGTLILLFGLRWLRKAILRAAGLMPLHDEQAAFEKNEAAMRRADPGGRSRWDTFAFAAAFNITALEGTEVVFIVIAFGAGGHDLLLPASLGAFAALLIVSALGALLHRPLTRIPENALKFVVGVVLSAFGTFWVGEGAGVVWPGHDLIVPPLIAAYLALALALVPACRARVISVEA